MRVDYVRNRSHIWSHVLHWHDEVLDEWTLMLLLVPEIVGTFKVTRGRKDRKPRRNGCFGPCMTLVVRAPLRLSLCFHFCRWHIHANYLLCRSRPHWREYAGARDSNSHRSRGNRRAAWRHGSGILEPADSIRRVLRHPVIALSICFCYRGVPCQDIPEAPASCYAKSVRCQWLTAP